MISYERFWFRKNVDRWLCWLNGGHGYGEYVETGVTWPHPRGYEIDAEGNKTPREYRELSSECWRCGHKRFRLTVGPVRRGTDDLAPFRASIKRQFIP